MKRSFAKKESGAAGRKRRKLALEEAQKSSQLFKAFLENPRGSISRDAVGPSSSTTIVLEPNRSSTNVSAIEEELECDENINERSNENVDMTVGTDGGNDTEFINEILPDNNNLNEVDGTDNSRSVIPEVIEQHDIGLLKFKKDTGIAIVSDTLRTEIVKKGSKYFQNSDGPFQQRNNRSMHKSWFKRKLGDGEEVTRSWLAYSPSKGSAFCICCLVFSQSKSSSSLEQESGFNHWKSPERMSIHENAKDHRVCFTLWNEMERNLAKNIGIIDVELQAHIDKEKQKWREILTRLLHCVKFLACQNLALRGHRESLQLNDDTNVGNFLGLLKLLATFDPVMKEHLTYVKNNPGSTSYLSPGVQNEFIHLMANTVRQSLLKNIRKAKYYGLMFDSTPDQAHREQMSEVVRYVDIDFEKKTVRVRESFLGFIQINQKDAQSLVEYIVKQLENDKMELQDCRSQCYDNAAVMAGHKSGVHHRMTEKNHLAVFVNCNNHSLNLVGVSAAKQDVMMVTFFGIVEALYVFFSRSTLRWAKLKNAVPVVLQSESETRWSSRTEAVSPINKYLDEILQVLLDMMDDENQTSETRSDARHLYNRMLSYDFLTLLGFWDKLLTCIDRVQKRLQDPSMNFHDAALDLKALRDHFHNEREVLLSESIENGLSLCQAWDVEFERRRRGKKRMPAEKSSDVMLTAKQEMERVMKETLDRLHREMDERFIRLHDTDGRFGFILNVEQLCYGTDNSELKTKCGNLGNFYSCDIDGKQLYGEIMDCRMLLSSRDKKISRPEDLLEFIVQYGDASVFPNLRVAIQILLTIAVSIASCETSFSKLKLILDYLRSSMGQGRLNDLAQLSVEREETERTDFEDIIGQFAAAKARKVQF